MILAAAGGRSLARAVRGPVLTPGSAAYARACPVFAVRFDGRRPKAIVQALDARDAQAAIRWAAWR